MAADAARSAGDRGQPPGRHLAHRRRRAGGRGRRRSPAAAFNTCARLVDSVKAPATGVEAPVLRRRHRRVGRVRLTVKRAAAPEPASGGGQRRAGRQPRPAADRRAAGQGRPVWSADAGSEPEARREPETSCVWIACQNSLRYVTLGLCGGDATGRPWCPGVGSPGWPGAGMPSGGTGSPSFSGASGSAGGAATGRGTGVARVGRRRRLGRRRQHRVKPAQAVSGASVCRAHACGESAGAGTPAAASQFVGGLCGRDYHRSAGGASAGPAGASQRRAGSGSATSTTAEPLGGGQRRIQRAAAGSGRHRSGAGGGGLGPAEAAPRQRCGVVAALGQRGARQRADIASNGAGGGGGAKGSSGGGGGGSRPFRAGGVEGRRLVVDDVARRRARERTAARRPRALALAAPAHARRPRSALPWWRGGRRRVLAAAVPGPGARRELQPALVAVAGVDGPVAAGLAAGDLVPFAVGGRAGLPGEGEAAATDDSAGEGDLCDVDRRCSWACDAVHS